jgi:26S proteasome regulatory subunit N12
MEIELIPANELIDNAYIRHPFSLEQWLMEGSYSKVFSSKKQVPDDLYIYFMDILLDTVRVEIADCIEKAYDTIGLEGAAEMLNCSDPNILQQFVQARKWIVDSSGKRFLFSKKQTQADKLEARQTIPADKLASEVLDYARELEKIV